MTKAQQTLANVDTSQRFRHDAGTAADTVNRMIGLQSVTAYATGASDETPKKPAEITDADWQSWLDVASLVRQGHANQFQQLQKAQLSDVAARIAVELLFQSGETMAAVDFAADRIGNRYSLMAARDFMIRLDLSCGGYTGFPGQSLLLGGAIVFDFPK